MIIQAQHNSGDDLKQENERLKIENRQLKQRITEQANELKAYQGLAEKLSFYEHFFEQKMHE